MYNGQVIAPVLYALWLVHTMPLTPAMPSYSNRWTPIALEMTKDVICLLTDTVYAPLLYKRTSFWFFSRRLLLNEHLNPNRLHVHVFEPSLCENYFSGNKIQGPVTHSLYLVILTYNKNLWYVFLALSRIREIKHNWDGRYRWICVRWFSWHPMVMMRRDMYT